MSLLETLGLDERIAIENALSEGKITRKEYEYFLQANNVELAVDEPTRMWPTVIIITSLLLLLGIGAVILDGGITGFVTTAFEETETIGVTFTNNGAFELNVSNISMIKINGAVSNGAVNVTARKGNNTWLIYSGNSSLQGVRVDKQSYALNETIQISVTPEKEYSYWLTENGTKTPVTTYVTNTPGTFTLEAISNTSKLSTTFVVRNDSNTSNDILTEETKAIIGACVETCTLGDVSNVTIEVSLSINATFFLEEILVMTLRENNAPIQTANIPDKILNNSATINLSQYFADPDGDELVYEMNNIIGVIETVNGSQLHLEGVIPGVYTATVYASDLVALVQASFDIVVKSSTNQTNKTTTEVSNPINSTNKTTSQTINHTNNTTNTTTQTSVPNPQPLLTNTTLGCNHPNVNKRPPECFGDQFDAAFQEVIAPLKDKSLSLVGRFTRFGNLIIRGTVNENTTGVPSNNDFTIGYSQQDGFVNNYVTTAWIDTDGNLHLQGLLYEEQSGLTAPQYDSFIVQNNNGLILGYFNERTGDLFLKGNIVQLGKP